MFGLCKYKEILGIPGKGIHSYRFADMAVADIIQTILGGVLIGYFMRWNIAVTVLGLFAIGIISHRIFCVRTTVDKWLFPHVIDT